jgi:hypothetical protein
MSAKPAPATPAYVLQMQASMLVARMYGDDAYSVADDLGPDDLRTPEPCDPNDPATPGLCGVNPQELAEWSEQADRAIERRHFVAAELARQRDHARAEALRFRERATRLEREIERVKAPALALMLAKRELGEVDKEGKVRVKTACVSAWLVETESVDGPEDGRDWPEAFQRVSVEPDRAGAKAVLQLGASADPRDLAALAEAGVRVRPNVTLGWRS